MVAVKAFYYDGKYYLLPKEDRSVSQLRDRIGDGVQLTLTELCEVRCMAPYFTMNGLAERQVLISDPRRIYPVDAFLMPAEEYDTRLRTIVEAKCPGCFRYGNDAQDLSGHYEEISLDGQCLEREDDTMKEGLGSLYEPAFAVEDFWFSFVKHEELLTTQIDRGELIQATAAVNELLAEVQFHEYVFPAISKYVYRDPQDREVKRYVLMLTGGGFLCSELIASYFVRCVPASLAARWDIYPYAVRGFYTHLPILTGCNPEADPPLLRVLYLEEQDLFSVYMYLRWDAGSAEAQEMLPPEMNQNDEDIPANVFCANYLYLCQIIGEERLRGAVLELVPFPKSEMVFEGDCVTAQEFSEMIDAQIRDRERLSRKRCNLRHLEMEGIQERRKVSHLTTYCEQLSFDLILGFEGSSLYLWDGGMALGCVFIPQEYLLQEDDMAFISELLLEHLHQLHYTEPVDICVSSDGVFFDFVVMNKIGTRKALRNLAPVLRAFGARYTERMNEESITYEIDFILRKLPNG